MIDTYGRKIDYLRLSVTELCNLRCRYCMPPQGIVKKRHEDMLSEDEMVLAVKAAVSLGFCKVRITGGEPLVKKNILSICHRVSQTGIGELCLTTNGTLLSQLARPLKSAGVSRINISLDTLDPEKYKSITRTGELTQAVLGIESALAVGFSRIKINTVLMGGFNDDEIPVLAELTKRYPIDLRFIELMPMPMGQVFPKEAFIPASAVLEALPEAKPLRHTEGTAVLYRLPNALGNIGLIRPISHSFCGDCNRLRLTADGRLKPCLHGNEEFPLKGLDFEGMREQFVAAVNAKPPCHGDLLAEGTHNQVRSMNRIGG